ncbi:MAG: hypothetical protein CL608_01350 [Anaerolineaceae bacterium]|nr:hypothetical protein [Anaerolineaceae bacterium]
MRQQIPNLQIKDAAEQYMHAFEILGNKPPASGILLPLMNVAAIAIELYLKSLSSEVVYTPDEQMEGISIVTAKPHKVGHELVQKFKEIPESLQIEMKQSYTSKYNSDSRSFEDVLNSLEGVFMKSRYPFEKDKNISEYSLVDLKNVCKFLNDYVADIEVTETITFDHADQR